MNDEGGIEKIDLEKVDWRGSREFFESLGEALDRLDDKDESYDFTWVGKRKSIIEAGAPINKTFRPDVRASKNWDTTENLFIEGDNLDALKLLQESYLGKVKMIYIDPPYNTGKDFVYHDNFKASTEQYDEDTEYRDESGNIQFRKNEKTNGRYHSDWLSMMYPRLKLAKNLLHDDGVIFISIDDNEVDNLVKLCGQIFGEDSIEKFVWEKVGDGDAGAGKMKAAKRVRIDHEYIITCRKTDIDFKRRLEVPNFKNEYTNPDNDPRGPYKAGNMSKTEEKSNPKGKNYYSVTAPGGRVFSRQWHFDKERFDQLDSDNRIYWGKSGNNAPAIKIFVNEPRQLVNSSLLSGLGSATSASKRLRELFNGKDLFDNPKPLEVVERLIYLQTDSSDTIIDFFSGSATTAHATMQLNAEDGGNRKWIMVQLPEVTDEKSEAFKAGYKTIPDIARERIRRAGDKIAAEHAEAKVDYGFRALTIDDTNYKEVYKPAGELQQSALLDDVDNIKADRSELDLLFGVLTATALELNRPLETRDIAGASVYLYDYLGEVSGLVACFSENISEDTIKEIAKLKPLTAVFREASFPDSQAKVNLGEHFRIISPETKVKVI